VEAIKTSGFGAKSALENAHMHITHARTQIPQSQLDAAALELARSRSASEAAQQQLGRQQQTFTQQVCHY